MDKPTTSAEVREHLVQALEADLVGPFGGPEEVLELPPSRWYLTGFLAPQAGRDLLADRDPTADEELGAGDDEDEVDPSAPDPLPKPKSFFPASLGISVLLPRGPTSDVVGATVSWADYEKLDEGEGEKKRGWKRIPHAPVRLELPLDPKRLADGVEIPDSRGLRLVGQLKEVGDEPGTRALAVFLVNARQDERGRADENYAFQTRLELLCERGLVGRRNRRGERSGDWDERVADLQFRERVEYAVGHGVSVESDGRAAWSSWIPRAVVRRVETFEGSKAVTAMEELADLPDGKAVRRAVAPIVQEYGAWIEAQRDIRLDAPERGETRKLLLQQAEDVRRRIEKGIALLEEDENVLLSFRLANRAMAAAARQRSPERYERGGKPEWRLFQLAFLLLSLAGVAQEDHPDRETVDLIFFPTGGGKTEAYLGVIAVALILRRLQGRSRPDRGLGVAVLLRYTLRLLTLDQLGRAATLMCALEKIRREERERLGDVRFAVGLWVGRSATANTLDEVRKQIVAYKNGNVQWSPFPLTHCPWCRRELTKDSFALQPSRTKPTEVVVGCASYPCDFAAGRNPEGLPVLFVDEQIYRELPSFVVATVDKFAMLPWRGETGMLFGRVLGRDGRKFFGPMDELPKSGEPLPNGLRPPDLVIQDELHLISGPLGTMVGLYETAIDYLCAREAGEKTVRSKIIASTATVRRAREQAKALFTRRAFSVFPPPAVDDSETFFARVDRRSEGRLYVGIAAQGRAMKAILLRTYVALLAAAQKMYGPRGSTDSPADPYMTVVGYFNSLRELGGMRRLVEDEVRTRCGQIETKRPRGFVDDHPWFAHRSVQEEPVELTSRENTYRIAEAKSRLARPHADEQHVDVVLATNMISVGVDIERLGLMVVAGQPKSSSEYIQASSRVGRDVARPGLVVTVFNLAKPRDRSHYERFTAYHDSFYRYVEASSVTPFAAPALERGMAAAIVAMARLGEPGLTPSAAVMRIADHRAVAERVVREFAKRGSEVRSKDGDKVRAALEPRGFNLIDSWQALMKRSREEAAAERCYSEFDRDHRGKALLRTVLDPNAPSDTDEAKFTAPTSMRDVEHSVHLWLLRGHERSKKNP